ncbi:hypothetical protein EBO15_40345 [Actinomadura harenae]|uniref:Uncharacterized protein n=1 Tax=Actinomadura harenae TaxID=2483351 RepID=A0A3M2LAX1_9ACTN|nr:hypothetical protein EBO15_40345 [Actinomadura harenae]
MNSTARGSRRTARYQVRASWAAWFMGCSSGAVAVRGALAGRGASGPRSRRPGA